MDKATNKKKQELCVGQTVIIIHVDDVNETQQHGSMDESQMSTKL